MKLKNGKKIEAKKRERGESSVFDSKERPEIWNLKFGDEKREERERGMYI